MIPSRARRVLFAGFALAASACADGPAAPRTGTLALQVVGLPAGVPAAIVLRAPDRSARSVTATGALDGLAAGEYTITAASVTARGSVYAPGVETISVTVPAGGSIGAAVAYGITTGALVVAPQGLPDGVPSDYVLLGPGGFARTVAAHDTLLGLAPGRYLVSGRAITTPADSWEPVGASQATDVLASESPATVHVAYTLTTGRIAVDIEELPAGSGTPVTVSGANGYAARIGGDTVLTGLEPGRYTVTAAGATVAGAPWVGVPSLQAVDVAAGPAAATVALRYTPRPPFDLSIAAVTLSQSVQRADGSIPLVAGRPAYLRVAVIANGENSARPRVRVRYYRGGALVATDDIASSLESVPQRYDDNALASTWNVVVPASIVQPGLGIVAEVDVEGAVAEADDQNNAYPSQTPLALDVRSVPPAMLRIVPIAHAVSGATGSMSNWNELFDMAYRAYPLGEVQVDVRAPFVTSAPVLQPDDANGAWQQIVSELLALRVAESSSYTYYGVARAPYSGGVAGMALLGQPVAMGWDRMPSGIGIAAHELGHTWGRMHAPCGGVAGADPSYPYLFGMTGVVGYDIGTHRLRSASSSDLMGYCGDPWISDYTYMGVLGFRGWSRSGAALVAGNASVGAGQVVTTGPEQSTLLVWGRVTASGEVILEPAFEVRARPTLPARAGANRVRGLSAEGAELFSLAFDATGIADAAGARAFAFAVPLDARSRARLASLHVAGARGTSRAVRGREAEPAQRPTLERTGGRARLGWDAATHPAAMLRDAATGRILGIVRGGSALVPAREAMEVLLSDGVRSVVTRVE